MDYDEDDLYDYEDAYEEEPQTLSAEDKEHMRTGTIAVREGLGDTSDFTTDKEIQDALWHYFYDTEKSIAYLKKQKNPAEQQEKPKKQKALSKFDQAAQQAQVSVDGASMGSSAPLWSFTTHFPSDFFADTPFLAVPQSRLGNLHPISVSRVPRGRLLGGSSNAAPSAGKPSKLAALAASRKKAAEEKRKAEAAGSSKQGTANDNSIGTESRLGKRQKTGPPEVAANVEGTTSAVEGLSLEEAIPSASKTDTVDHAVPVESVAQAPAIAKRSYPRKEQRLPETTNAVPQPVVQPVVEEEPEIDSQEYPKEDLQAAPSSFANSLFSAPGTRREAKAMPNPAPLFPLHDYTGLSNHDPFSGPSPDDIVRNAQQGKGSKSTTKPGAKKKSANNDTTNGMKNLRLDDSAPTSGTSTPAQMKIKSKNIDVAAEYAKGNHKRSANFVVIGHVDHGKSTLMGRLLHDSSYISSRDFSKLSASAAQAGKSSFSYAWLMDSTAEERARGITVDIAQTSFSTPATETTPATDFNILDAPGHKDFVPNMIAGASQADFAVLVVDASTGEFEKGLEGGGQTKEHALLVRGLGVQSIVVAVNKMDQTNWNESRFQEISGQIVAFLSKIGYRNDDIRVVPCAGLTGENVVFRTPPVTTDKPGKSSAKAKPATSTEDSKDRFSWYEGPTLLTCLSAFTPQEHNLQQPLRITISDVFRGSVTNPLSISGRLDAGTVQVGDVLLAMPAAETCIVRGIDATSSISSAKNSTASSDYTKNTDYAVAGQIATLHLAEIDAVHLRLGDVLCTPAAPIKNATGFTAKVLAFEHVMPGTLDCHRGRMHCSASITKLLGLVGAKEGAPAGKKRPRVVKPGQGALVAVKLEKPLPLEVGTRIVLRSEGNTIAAGVVEEVVS